MAKTITLNVSGGIISPDHDTKQKVNYLYSFRTDEEGVNTPTSKESYETLKENGKQPIILNYIADEGFNIAPSEGLYPLTEADGGANYSFFKREVLGDNQYGEWQPVAIDFRTGIFEDVNVSNGRTYQYIVYPSEQTIEGRAQYPQVLNSAGEILNEEGIVTTTWNNWSITELLPVKNVISNSPTVKQSYKADTSNAWLFKYNLEVGSQEQHINKNARDNLSQYPKFSHGMHNYLSGTVNCMLGYTIVPYKGGYVERLRGSGNVPLTSNQKTDMLQAWRKLVYSRNPKLLKDEKGQQLLVHLTSSSNTPMIRVSQQPDQISFAWTEIGSLNNVVITNK